jgi:hypothetical protein
VERVNRRAINLAPYNPRFIDAFAKKRLKERLRKDGLVEPLIWNRRTGNLVGGHQRIQQIDELEGTDNYSVEVSVIDVDPQAEKSLNVWLNNPAVQGQFDLGKLELLFTEFGANPFDAGFERLDLELMFSPETVEHLLDTFAPPTDPNDALDEQQAAGLPGTPPDAADAARQVQQIKALKDRRKEYIGQQRESVRSDHIVVVVFDSMEATSAFMEKAGLDSENQFVASDRFLAALDALYGKPVLAADAQAEQQAPNGVATLPDGRTVDLTVDLRAKNGPLPGPVDPPPPPKGGMLA